MSDETKQPDTLAICNVCQEKKIRNPSGKFPNGKDTKFVNEKDRSWNGKRCPDCQGKKMGAHMKAKRNKDVQ